MKISLLAHFPAAFYKKHSGRNRIALTDHKAAKNLIPGFSQIKDVELSIITFVREDFASPFVTRENGVDYYYLKGSKYDGIYGLYQARKGILAECLKAINPDIVHGQGTEREYSYLAVNSGLPNVITIHGLMRKFLPFLGASMLYSLFVENIERYTIKRAMHIIALNPWVVKECDKISHTPISVIENPIEGIFYNIERSDGGDCEILFIGSIDPRKGIEYLIRAFHLLQDRFPRATVRLVGDTHGLMRNEQYKADLMRYIREKSLSGKIEFSGWCESEDIAKYMSTASMLVLPSLQETAPLVISESMAAGLPVVSTWVGGIPGMIKDGINGLLVEPKNSEMLAQKIALILEDHDLRNSIIMEAKKDADNFRIDVIARKTYQLYRKILKLE